MEPISKSFAHKNAVFVTCIISVALRYKSHRWEDEGVLKQGLVVEIRRMLRDKGNLAAKNSELYFE